jgi:hypothetical protein
MGGRKILVFYVLVFFLAVASESYGQQSEKQLEQSEFTKFVGTWIGYGAGEEVRFRDKNRLLVLTVKHKTEFIFVIDADGSIQGEGTIEYNLENNTSGLDHLVASVHALMGLAQVPPIIKDKDPGPKGGVAEEMGKMTREVPGVTRIQYEAPHLKNGPEIRHFKFTGRAVRGSIKNKQGKEIENVMIVLDEVLNFYLPDGEPNNTLIAVYEVNKVKTETPFPCWSPFLKVDEGGAAVVRSGPGGIYIAEFQKQGKHREGKRVWEEYSYVWMARQINPGTKK